MTISELTLKSSDVEPVRRFEVFTGTGRRREWPAEEKARIVAESYEADESVSAVARRYAFLPGRSRGEQIVRTAMDGFR